MLVSVVLTQLYCLFVLSAAMRFVDQSIVALALLILSSLDHHLTRSIAVVVDLIDLKIVGQLLFDYYCLLNYLYYY